MSTIGTSSGNKAIGNVVVGTASGNKTVSVGYIGTTTGNKVWFSALSASAAPDFVSGTAGVPTVVTSPSTATPSGGIGPFTYAWAFLSGGAITAVSPTSATTVFQGTGMASPETRTSFFECTITDTGTGLSAVTNTVEAEVNRT